MRTIQERVARQRGVTLDEQLSKLPPAQLPPLYGPEPVEFEDLREVWKAVSSTKNADIPVTYTDVKDYCYLTGNELEPWEVETIFIFDKAWKHTYSGLRSKSMEN